MYMYSTLINWLITGVMLYVQYTHKLVVGRCDVKCSVLSPIDQGGATSLLVGCKIVPPLHEHISTYPHENKLTAAIFLGGEGEILWTGVPSDVNILMSLINIHIYIYILYLQVGSESGRFTNNEGIVWANGIFIDGMYDVSLFCERRDDKLT